MMERQILEENFKCFAGSDKGKIRNRNEDRVFLNTSENLFGVIDGMGGLKKGEEAAEIAASYMESSAWKESFMYPTTISEAGDQACEWVEEIVYEASQELAAYNYDWYVRYGCTLSGVVLMNRNQEALFFNVGDSRGYLYHKENGILEQITKDHSEYQHLLDEKKEVSEEELKKAKHLLCRYLGSKQDSSPDLFKVQIKSGDLILLCTDGLYNEVPEEQIREILENKEGEELFQKGKNLLEYAMQTEGKDNISFVLLEII